MNAAKVYLVEWLIEDDDSPFFVVKGSSNSYASRRKASWSELLNQTVLLCICCYVHVLCMIRVPSKRILWGGNVGSERGNTMIGVAAQ